MIRNDYNIDDCPSLFGSDDDEDDDDDDDEVDVVVDVVGFIRQCYFNQIFEQIQQFDTVRYSIYSTWQCAYYS